MNERIFHLSGDESIEKLKEFIEESTADTVVFLFPRKSWIFQQNTDLISLRTIADEQRKELIIVTKNAIARMNIQAMGISVLASLEDREKTPFEKMKNSTNLSPQKISKISYISLDSLEKIIQKKNRARKELGIEAPQNVISRPVIHSLVLLGVLMVIFFLFLLKVAIPDVTVTITPFKKEDSLHININMLSNTDFEESDLWRVNNGIFMYPLEKVYTVEKTFTNISKEFRGKNATGKMKIINMLPHELTFRSGTRMQNKDGIIFVTQDWIKIPAAQGDVFGEIEIDVEASEMSKYNKFQGEDANMPKGQKFIFPGLSEENQKKVLAENTTLMKGGETQWVYKISKENIEKARKDLLKFAAESEESELLYAMHQRFPEKKTEMKMLPLQGDHIEREVLHIAFELPEEELIGKEQTEFTGSVQMRIKNYIYSSVEVNELIESKFTRSALEGMEFVSLDTEFLNPKILKTEDDNTRLKVSFSARGVYQYIIEPKSKKGLEFSQRAKNSILGVDKEEAEIHLINNFKEISDVEIVLWPFWVKNLPTLPEKIQFKIKEDE